MSRLLREDGLVFAGCAIFIWSAVVGGILYVIVHFARKFW